MSAQKCCSKCGETKEFDKFIKNRNICKMCDNARKIKKYKAVVIDNSINQHCTECNENKPMGDFIRTRTICKACNNKNRRNRYQTNEEHRLKAIKAASEFKHAKVIERREIKLQTIGENNKKCSCCSEIKSMDNFRHNRLKCKICERDEPLDKFKRNVRSRIYIALKACKEHHTIKYLGCSSTEYLEWLLHNDKNYTLDNQGKVWHIDHVIPLSTFDLEDKQQQFIAFNWRNTMPLAARDNLSKNRKIIIPQIEQHYQHLLIYHKEKNIEMPQEFIDLFAKHLVAGNPLEPSLPPDNGNIIGELG
uniref:Uncharacterized protein n=1 Tax=viral metagenome TaxID=1070528 RepID=A0A6C0KKQ8_9ZZZZ